MSDAIPHMTVAQLAAALEKLPQDARVQVWLPGQYIDLAHAWLYREGLVMIEGNAELRP